MNVQKRNKLLSVLIKPLILFLTKEKRVMNEKMSLGDSAYLLKKKNVGQEENGKVNYKEMEDLLKTDISTENIL